MGLFSPGKSIELCSTKAPWSFAMRNLFTVGNYDSVRRCAGVIQGQPDKNRRTETRIKGGVPGTT